MRTLVKVVVWFAVFAGAAGVGAYIAAHSEPFPPTADPGNSFNTPTPSSAPAPMWRVLVTSATRHDPIYVAGFTSIPQWCATRWKSTFTFTIDPDTGALRGTGLAKRLGKLRCTFAQAQAELQQINLKVVGAYRHGKVHTHLVNTGQAPVGADDYGGFTRTLLIGGARSSFDIAIPATSGTQSGSFSFSYPDGDRGLYRSKNRFQISCVRGCGG